jgi:hypothetical protein
MKRNFYVHNVAFFLPVKTQLLIAQIMEMFPTRWDIKPEGTTCKKQRYHQRRTLKHF